MAKPKIGELVFDSLPAERYVITEVRDDGAVKTDGHSGWVFVSPAHSGEIHQWVYENAAR